MRDFNGNPTTLLKHPSHQATSSVCLRSTTTSRSLGFASHQRRKVKPQNLLLYRLSMKSLRNILKKKLRAISKYYCCCLKTRKAQGFPLAFSQPTAQSKPGPSSQRAQASNARVCRCCFISCHLLHIVSLQQEATH